MARHYSTRDFFRQIPNQLLARYFHGQGLFADLDIAYMKETKTEKLFRVWLDLPDERRNEMDAEFRGIFEMGCEKGFRAILSLLRHLRAAPGSPTNQFSRDKPSKISNCRALRVTSTNP